MRLQCSLHTMETKLLCVWKIGFWSLLLVGQKKCLYFGLRVPLQGKAMFCKLKGLSTHLHSVTFDSTFISLSGTLSASVVLRLGLSWMSRRHVNTDSMAFIQYSCWDIPPVSQMWDEAIDSKLVRENLHISLCPCQTGCIFEEICIWQYIYEQDHRVLVSQG